MDAILQTIRNLGPARLAVIGALAFGLIAFFVFMATRLTTPQMALLYGDLDPSDTARIAQQLESKNIPFNVKNETSIYVPQDQVHKMRLEVVNLGLTGGGAGGYEILDKQETLGTTNFMQNVNLVRALEGELARTIKSLDSVNSARVHLVWPKRELFSRERMEPSASIILKMRGANRLNKEQVQAVQHLVAGAVPGLNPTRISIVDDKGALLARGFEEEGGLTAVQKAEERRLAQEQRIARTIEDLLEKTVGYGKVRAEVSAEIDYDRVSTQQEIFDPDGQVVRSTQTMEETASSSEGQMDVPIGVAQNLPDASGAGDSASAQNQESRIEETVNYEITKKVVNHIREGGVMRRLSVAVLVDGIHEGSGADAQYRERTQAEMELLATLVRGAIGFDADRGDTVEVINMRFAEPPIPDDEALELFFGFGKDDLLRMAEILVLSIVAILVILLVVRPLLSRAFESLPGAAGTAEGLLAERAGAPALTGPGGMPLPVPSDGMMEEEAFEELIDIDRVEGRVKASSVRKVGEIVEKHPEEALSIIRSWMYQESGA